MMQMTSQDCFHKWDKLRILEALSRDLFIESPHMQFKIKIFLNHKLIATMFLFFLC